MVGRPEGDLILTELALYLATAPKSNTVIRALTTAKKLLKEERAYEVPDHLKDSHYEGAKRLGRGTGYVYPHGKEEVEQSYLPQELKGAKIFDPTESGEEKTLVERWKKLFKNRRAITRESSNRGKEGK